MAEAKPKKSGKLSSNDPAAVLKTISEVVTALIEAFEKNEKINLTKVNSNYLQHMGHLVWNCLEITSIFGLKLNRWRVNYLGRTRYQALLRSSILSLQSLINTRTHSFQSWKSSQLELLVALLLSLLCANRIDALILLPQEIFVSIALA